MSFWQTPENEARAFDRLQAAPAATINNAAPSIFTGLGEAVVKAPFVVGGRGMLAFEETVTPYARAFAQGVGGDFGKKADQWLADEQALFRKQAVEQFVAPAGSGWLAEKLVYGVAVPVTEMVGAGILGGPWSAAGYGALTTYHLTRAQYEAQGVTGGDEVALAAGTAAFAGLGALIPGMIGYRAGASVGSNVARIGGIQGAINVPLGAGQRFATQQYLEAQGYGALASQMHPFAVSELVTDFVLGWALGGGFARFVLPRGTPTPGAAPDAPDAPDAPGGPRGPDVEDILRQTEAGLAGGVPREASGEYIPGRRDALGGPPRPPGGGETYEGELVGRPLLLGPTADVAMASNSEGHALIDVAPGLPADVATANAHTDAVRQAMQALLRGDPVAVHALIDGASFLPKPPDVVDAEARALDDVNAALAEAMTDADAVRSLEYGFNPPAPEPTGPTPEAFGETARKRFLKQLRARGGIDMAEAPDITGERGFRASAGAAGIFRRPVVNAAGGRDAGHAMDRHVEWMVEQGYLQQRDVDEDPGGAVEQARELVRQALDKQAVLTVDQWEEMGRLQAEHEAAGFTRADYEAAGYDDLPPMEQLEFQRALAYAEYLDGLESEIQRLRTSGEGRVLDQDGAPWAGWAGARAEGDAGGSSLQALARESEPGGQVADPKRDEYTQDLFGGPLPAAPERTDNGRTGEAVETAVEVSPGIFATKTALVTTGRAPLGVERITGVADAAHAFAYLRKQPQENVAILTVDKQGRPLAIIRHALGGRAAVGSEFSNLFGSALRDPQTAEVWVAHNHPSGMPELSPADKIVGRDMAKALMNTTVKYRGFFAIGGDKYAHADEFGRVRERQDIPPMRRKFSVAIQERTFRKAGKLSPSIMTSVDTIATSKKVANGQDGLMLLNFQREAVAFVPMSVADMEGLGATDPVMRRRLYEALEMSNASMLVAVTHGMGLDPGSESPHGPSLGFTARALVNVHNAAAQVGVKTLDGISLKDRASARGTGFFGKAKEPGAMAAEGEADTGELTPYTNADILRREQDQLALSKRDQLQRKAADEKALADAQRDAFTLTGSDRPADQPGQNSLFEPGYPDYPGTVDDPMPRETFLAAADARMAEAEQAEPALFAAVNCFLSQGGRA